MKTIHKYPLVVGGLNHVTLPAGAEIVHVAEQRDTPCLWALVETDAPMELRVFRVLGTGMPIEPRDIHIGTVLVAGGVLVWHCFECVRSEVAR